MNCIQTETQCQISHPHIVTYPSLTLRSSNRFIQTNYGSPHAGSFPEHEKRPDEYTSGDQSQKDDSAGPHRLARHAGIKVSGCIRQQLLHDVTARGVPCHILEGYEASILHTNAVSINQTIQLHHSAAAKLSAATAVQSRQFPQNLLSRACDLMAIQKKDQSVIGTRAVSREFELQHNLQKTHYGFLELKSHTIDTVQCSLRPAPAILAHTPTGKPRKYPEANIHSSTIGPGRFKNGHIQSMIYSIGFVQSWTYKIHRKTRRPSLFHDKAVTRIHKSRGSCRFVSTIDTACLSIDSIRDLTIDLL